MTCQRMMQLSGTKPESMLKSLFRVFICLKSFILITLWKHMCACWELLILQWARDTYNASTDMDIPENDCPELTEKTVDAIDNANCSSPLKWTALIFVVKLVLSEYHIKIMMSRHVLGPQNITVAQVLLIVLSKFPHYWVCFTHRFSWLWKYWAQSRLSEK